MLTFSILLLCVLFISRVIFVIRNETAKQRAFEAARYAAWNHPDPATRAANRRGCDNMYC